MHQLTQEQAIALASGGEWRDWTDAEIVKVQLYQDRLCVPFARYHAALEAVLGRPVYTHELIDLDRLRAEYEGQCPAPTLDEILALLPAHIIVYIA